MPRRDDIHSILIIGSGPIVIGQGCEFDYSGVQACRALREEGYRIVLINSNPATIMTDPEFADATYIEPITPEAVEKILRRERDAGTPVDALLPTLGGQTGLNTGMACFDQGILTRYVVKMIGADREAIYKGEDRQVFKDLMISIGLKVPRSGVVHSIDEARKVLEEIGLPLIIRPAFTLGGTGGGISYNVEEFETIVQRGLDASPVTEVLIEQSVIGWKEFEMEVMRDRNDNVVIICSIENVDAMGVHTGDSITVAPIQTLTDKEYQRMRDASIAVIRAVGVETGGSNIQFAINPADGEMVVVEMNPRVSRSSALASKATGYPIARIAALLAVGYTLDELPNFITSDEARGLHTSACFEPTIDYCVIKIPRWTFEKFPDADETLTTQMKSVGEAMAIGRTFKEALQKGIRSMEVKRFGFGLDRYDKWKGGRHEGTEARRHEEEVQSDAGPAGRRDEGEGEETHVGTEARGHEGEAQSRQAGLSTLQLSHSTFDSDKTAQGESAAGEWPIPEGKLRRKLAVPSQGRLYYIRYALKMGWSIQQVHDLTRIDPWFLAQMKELVDFERVLQNGAGADAATLDRILRQAKQWGYSDVQLASICRLTPYEMRSIRQRHGINPVYKLVDTCAAEFEAATPYYYSTYEQPYVRVNGGGEPDSTVEEDEIRLTDRPKVIIIGGGPNRIGQGIEFDYCCVQAAFAMRDLGLESVMINSNPETVSTDYNTSDLLFFEPLTHEDVLNICQRLNGRPFDQPGGLVKGVIVQFGGQTPLNLARELSEAGVPILGTTVDSIDAAGDREQFRALVERLGLKQPANGIARNVEGARHVAREVGYPVLVRPSFVLGGRAMEIVSDEAQLNFYMAQAIEASGTGATATETPILIDKFLDNAIEVDVDCLADYNPAGDGDGGGGGGEAIIIGVMEHIEEAGIHSGDSACALPPYSLSAPMVQRLKQQTRGLAESLRVRGLMNVQYAIKDNEIYLIEVNPRASRTVPFVGKATGMPWARIAAKVMAGQSLASLGIAERPDPAHTSVKEVVFPFTKFPGVDVILGPEMRSTGEVMGIDANFPLAFAKSQIAAGGALPLKGTVYLSVKDSDKPNLAPIARLLSDAGFNLIATGGTFEVLSRADIPATRIPKLAEGRPNIKDYIKNAQVQLIINTPTRKGPATDEGKIRALAVLNRIPIVTTLNGAGACARAIQALQAGDWDVKPLQEYAAEK